MISQELKYNKIKNKILTLNKKMCIYECDFEQFTFFSQFSKTLIYSNLSRIQNLMISMQNKFKKTTASKNNLNSSSFDSSANVLKKFAMFGKRNRDKFERNTGIRVVCSLDNINFTDFKD